MATPSLTTPYGVNNTLLESLYGSFTTSNYSNGSTSSNIIGYVNYVTGTVNSSADQNTAYNNMKAAIYAWINNTSAPTAISSIGLPIGTAIDGLRVTVILPDGSVLFDSASDNANNILSNVNIPKSDFVTSGKYLIGVNHGGRTYFQSAALSNSGTAFQKKFSTTTNNYQYYYAVRQGSTSVQYGSIVVISANIPSAD
jgi:hypothetical protein